MFMLIVSRNCEDGHRHKSAMPAGWRRVLVQRKVGRTAGKFDVYIYRYSGLVVKFEFHFFLLLFLYKTCTC